MHAKILTSFMKSTMTRSKEQLKKTGKQIKNKGETKADRLGFLIREREELFIKSRDDVGASANVWDRVSREVDTSNAKTGYHTRDVSRMKELMLDLKKDPKAPGNMIEV